MTVVLLRLPDGTSIESDLQGHDPSGEHHYVALRDGVQLRAFTTIAEVAQFINAVLDADATRGGAPT